jgi:O-antigen ligase
MASFRIRRGAELFVEGGFDAQVKFQMLSWCLLGLLGLWLLLKGRADLRLVQAGPLFCYLLFIFAALLSVAVSPAPLISAYRAVQHGIALVLVISLRGNLNRMVAFIAAYLGVNYLLLVMGVTGLDFNQEWIEYYVRDQSLWSGDFMHRWRFTTAYGHPSWISIAGAVGAISIAARTRGAQWSTRWPLFALFVLATILTVSRTAIFGLFVGLAIVAVGRRRVFISLLFLLLPAAALLVSPEIREGIAHYLQRGQTERELEEFTGRAGLWRVATERIERSLPFGEGFQSGRVNPLEGDNENMAHAHNLILEAAAGTGIVGGLAVAVALVLWIAQLAWLLRNSRSPDEVSRAWELTAIAAPLLAFCVLDSGFANTLHHVTFLYLIAMARTQTAVLELQPQPSRARSLALATGGAHG